MFYRKCLYFDLNTNAINIHLQLGINEMMKIKEGEENNYRRCVGNSPIHRVTL